MELRRFVDKLKNKGDVAEVKEEKSRSFDLAFVEDRAYLIKVVGNADSLSKDSLEAFKKCASVVGAEPMVVSKKFKHLYDVICIEICYHSSPFSELHMCCGREHTTHMQ